jgi:hypothetical protein
MVVPAVVLGVCRVSGPSACRMSLASSSCVSKPRACSIRLKESPYMSCARAVSTSSRSFEGCRGGLSGIDRAIRDTRQAMAVPVWDENNVRRAYGYLYQQCWPSLTPSSERLLWGCCCSAAGVWLREKGDISFPEHPSTDCCLHCEFPQTVRQYQDLARGLTPNPAI